MAQTMKRLTIEISDTVYDLLAVLAGGDGPPNVTEVIQQLIDHAQQGVYRPGSWERPWLYSAFGDEWTKKLEPGDPYGRDGGAYCPFERPKKTGDL